jgi:hypothetical protein
VVPTQGVIPMYKIKDFTEILSSHNPKLLADSGEEMTFTNVELISKDTVFRKNTLYLGFQSQVQDLDLTGIILYLIKDLDRFSLPLGKNNYVVEFPKGTELDSLYERCNSLMEEKFSLLEGGFALLNTVGEELDLHEMVDTAAKLIDNPLIVLDNSYKVLAYSQSHEVKDYQWQQNIERGFCTFEYIAGFNSIEGVKNSPDSNEPFIIECFTSPLRRCISKLYIKKRQLGYLISVESNSSFDEMNMELFTLISNFIATAVSIKNKIQQHPNNKAYDSILIDGLEGNVKSESIFYERMKNTEFDTDSFYKVLVIDISSYNNFDPSSEHLKNLIKTLFNKFWTVSYKNSVVTLIDVGDKDYDIRKTLKAERNFFRENNLRVGISDTFTDLYRLRKYYLQATRALHIASKINPGELFSNYDGYRFYDLITSTAKNSEELRSFYCSDLVKIIKYDKKHNTQYFETVFQYLQCNRNLEETAQKLFIHKNTVSYRIRKVKEMFNIDFDNTYKRFKLYYSYLIHMMVMEEDLIS